MYMRKYLFVLILFSLIVYMHSFAAADSMTFTVPGGKINVEAPEIEISPSMLRALGGAVVELPPSSNLTIPGASGTPVSKAEPVHIEAPTVEVRYPAYKAMGGVKLTQGDTTMTAKEISGNFQQDTVQASGGVVFKQGARSLFAENFEYNYSTRTGQMQEARFQENHLTLTGRQIYADKGTLHLTSAAATTCDNLKNPDYRITASTIILTPDKKLIARGVSVWLGKTRILRLPRVVFSVASGQSRGTLFPRPGFDSFDGFYIGMTVPVTAGERLLSSLWVRWTTNNSFEWKLTNEFLISGKQIGVMDALRTGAEVELRNRPALLPAEPEKGTDIEMREGTGRQLRGFLDYSHKERIYDIDNTRLLLNREPEVGLRYIIPGIRVNEDSEYPELRSEGRISWGRFKENDNPQRSDRLDLRAFVAPTVIKLPSRFYILPVALGRYSHYSTGEDYQTLGLGVDVTKLLAPGTFGTFRYITHAIGGNTPFEFDDVDIPRELQGILQYRGKKDFVFLSLRYDLDNSELYDWWFTYGRTLHCLEPRITWRNRLSEISVELKVLGL